MIDFASPLTISAESGALFIQRGSSSLTIHPNGSVKLTPGVQLEYAAKLFWDAVEKNFPHEAAVKAERERCAGVAREYGQDEEWAPDYFKRVTRSACEEIARRILKGA